MLGLQKISKILNLGRKKAKNTIQRVPKIISFCKIEAKKTFDFSKSHPLGLLVLVVAATIYVYGGTGNKMTDIASAISLFSIAIAAINFEDKTLKKSRRDSSDRYESISIQLHPRVIEWAKREAEARGVDYKTIINEALLNIAR